MERLIPTTRAFHGTIPLVRSVTSNEYYHGELISDLLGQAETGHCNKGPSAPIMYLLDPKEKDLGGFASPVRTWSSALSALND